MQKNTFNMRQVTLMNLATSHASPRNGTGNDVKKYRRTGCVTNPLKSLELLRKNLQNAINRDMEIVIRKYLDVS